MSAPKKTGPGFGEIATKGAEWGERAHWAHSAASGHFPHSMPLGLYGSASSWGINKGAKMAGADVTRIMTIRNRFLLAAGVGISVMGYLAHKRSSSSGSGH